MPFDPVFTRDGVLPLAVTARTEAGLHEPGEAALDNLTVISAIEADPVAGNDVWREPHQNSSHAAHAAGAVAASRVLTTTIAGHAFGFVATRGDEVYA